MFFLIHLIYVLKTHFFCFNSHVNNLDDTEREQLFYGPKAIFWKNLKLGY